MRNRFAMLAEAGSLRMLRWVGATIFVDNDETHSALVARGFRSAKLKRTTNAYDPSIEIPTRNPALFR
jgi:hypothetical protein